MQCRPSLWMTQEFQEEAQLQHLAMIRLYEVARKTIEHN